MPFHKRKSFTLIGIHSAVFIIYLIYVIYISVECILPYKKAVFNCEYTTLKENEECNPKEYFPYIVRGIKNDKLCTSEASISDINSAHSFPDAKGLRSTLEKRAKANIYLAEWALQYNEGVLIISSCLLFLVAIIWRGTYYVTKRGIPAVMICRFAVFISFPMAGVPLLPIIDSTYTQCIDTDYSQELMEKGFNAGIGFMIVMVYQLIGVMITPCLLAQMSSIERAHFNFCSPNQMGIYSKSCKFFFYFMNIFFYLPFLVIFCVELWYFSVVWEAKPTPVLRLMIAKMILAFIGEFALLICEWCDDKFKTDPAIMEKFKLGTLSGDKPQPQPKSKV